MITLILFSVLIIVFYIKFQKPISNYGKCECGCRIMFPGMMFLALFTINSNIFGQVSNNANTAEMNGDFYYLEIADDRTYLGIITEEDNETVTIETKEMRVMKFQKAAVLSCEIVTWRKSKKKKKWFRKSENEQTESIWFTDLAKDLL